MSSGTILSQELLCRATVTPTQWDGGLTPLQCKNTWSINNESQVRSLHLPSRPPVQCDVYIQL